MFIVKRSRKGSNEEYSSLFKKSFGSQASICFSNVYLMTMSESQII